MAGDAQCCNVGNAFSTHSLIAHVMELSSRVLAAVLALLAYALEHRLP